MSCGQILSSKELPDIEVCKVVLPKTAVNSISVQHACLHYYDVLEHRTICLVVSLIYIKEDNK